jgi:hypothetical protein
LGVFVVFDFADRRLPWAAALGLTYAIAAYVILPRAVRMGIKVLQQKRVPRYTLTGDGLPGDPVNLALIGTFQQLRSLYLFGRGQDIGFQTAIDNSLRKRHHVRFWPLGLARAEATVGTASFWLNTDRPPDAARAL